MTSLTVETRGASENSLFADPLRGVIEQRVSTYLGRVWRVTRTLSRSGSASHPAAILSDGICSVFVKLGEGPAVRDQLDRESAGLRYLAERSGVLTPTVIATAEVEGTALLIMEAAAAVERGARQWRQMGRSLARIHSVKGERFGFETHCYWGDLYQDNSPSDDWAEFYWEHRIAPRLKATVDSGRLPVELAHEVERLRSRLPSLCGNEVTPSLLHGDAHQNNFLSTERGPVLIDPAVYYGHREVDLAYLDFFAPVSEQLFEGYQELAAIDSGFADRRELWLIPARLAMIEAGDAGQVPRLAAALRGLTNG